jgi:glucokinase
MRLGLDVGGTKIHAVALAADDAVVADVRLATGFGHEAVVARIGEAITRVSLEAFPRTGIESIGIGVPGIVDVGTGRVRHSVNLGIEDLELAGAVGAAVGVPVVVENDVNAATLGAAHASGLHGVLGYLNLGTGLAAGIAVDGVLWRGAAGPVGEIGHLPFGAGGVLCSCGQRGCLETTASGSALARIWPYDGPDRVQALFAAADAGDRRAISARDGLVTGAAAAIRILTLTVGVEAVILGGGVTRIGAPLVDEIRARLRTWEAESPFLATLLMSRHVHALDGVAPVAAIGAALLAAPLAAAKEQAFA